jgi:hypothetical protein
MPVLRSVSRCPKRNSASLAGLAAALGVLAALTAGCADRPRTNPLDPGNPETGGGPLGFTALAGNAQVALAWQAPPEGARIGGYLLERRVHGTTAYATLDSVLPPTTLARIDAAVANDSEYDYRLSFVLVDGGVSGAPVVRTARPGPEIVWVSDPGVDEIARMAPDGRTRALTLDGVEACNRVAVQLADGDLWAGSPLSGAVLVFGVDGSVSNSFAGLDEPNAIAVDPTSSSAWICEEAPGASKVRRWASDGTVLANGPVFGLASDVAIIPGGGVWVVDEQSGRLVSLNTSGAATGTFALPSDPRRIARDPIDGSLWVTCYSSGDVVHVGSNGGVIATYEGFNGPYGIDVDEFRNLVWVGLDGDGAVVGLRASDGGVVFRVGGIPHPRSLAVNDRTGECFVAAIASHELVRIDANGVVLSRNPNFSAPFDVKIDPGPRANPLPIAARSKN